MRLEEEIEYVTRDRYRANAPVETRVGEHSQNCVPRRPVANGEADHPQGRQQHDGIAHAWYQAQERVETETQSCSRNAIPRVQKRRDPLDAAKVCLGLGMNSMQANSPSAAVTGPPGNGSGIRARVAPTELVRNYLLL